MVVEGRRWAPTTTSHGHLGEVVDHEGTIVVDQLAHAYGDRVLFSGVTFAVAPGRSAAISGESGSGKSTLLALITGMVRARTGYLRIAGVDVARAGRGQLGKLRRERIGVVHQRGELIGTLSAVENVMIPSLLVDRRNRINAHERARSLLNELEVASPDLPAAELSGGERQRVALARALINHPKVLIADEPTAALDPDTRDAVANLIFSRTAREGCAVLVVTHDSAVATLADDQLVLSGGALRREVSCVDS